MTNPTSRIEVRLVDNHPAASRKEVARFKNVKKDEAIRLLAAAQIILHGTTSMWRCDLRKDEKWHPFGKNGDSLVKVQVLELGSKWHPLDFLSQSTEKE